jgi:hypothetical protein
MGLSGNGKTDLPVKHEIAGHDVRAPTALGSDSQQALWAIREVKALLDSYRKWIHSLILVGSYALGQAGRHSDADFLVLLGRGEKASYMSRILFDFEF